MCLTGLAGKLGQSPLDAAGPSRPWLLFVLGREAWLCQLAVLCVGRTPLCGPHGLSRKRRLKSLLSSPRAHWTARGGGPGVRMGSGTRGWRERALRGLHPHRPARCRGRRARPLRRVLFWCPRWVLWEGGRARRGHQGGATVGGDTAPGGREKPPSCPAPAPRPSRSCLEHTWKVGKRRQLCGGCPAGSGEGHPWPGALCTCVFSGRATCVWLSEDTDLAVTALCAKQGSTEQQDSLSEVGAGLKPQRASSVPHFGCDRADGRGHGRSCIGFRL